MAADLGIVEFLNARLDEDEAGARLAAREGGTWTQDDPVRFPGAISSLGGPVVYDEGAPDENQAPHIARHDPARVLREVAAKRAILDLHNIPAHVFCDDNRSGIELADHRCVGCGFNSCEEPRVEDIDECPVLRHLAFVFRDHPDWQPEWAPASEGGQ